LLLDEPTNHLDIPAKQTLEEALRNFDGSVIVVSHDRYFISQVATKIVEIRDQSLVLYHGNYEYYLLRKEEEKQRALETKLAAEKAKREGERKAKQLAKKKK
jgi:ATP-binding cassette subfamily F protein 3